MTNMFTLMDILVGGCGGYLFYAWYLLMKKNEIKQSVLLPKEINPKSCKDPAGYRTYVGPRLLVFAIVATICGIVGLIQDYTQALGDWIYMAFIVFFFAAAVWFAYACRKALKRFW